MVKAQEQRCTKGLENCPGEWISLGQRAEASQHPPLGTFLQVTSLCAPTSTPGSSQAAASWQGSGRGMEGKEKLFPPLTLPGSQTFTGNRPRLKEGTSFNY